MASEGRQRLDRWLFFARVVKSRSLAARLVQGSGVRVNREKTDQPSHQVKVGDVLTIRLERQVLVYRVLDPGTRRGPASEARLLYENLGETQPGAVAEPKSDPVPSRPAGAGRPTKKDRRRLDTLRNGEDL